MAAGMNRRGFIKGAAAAGAVSIMARATAQGTAANERISAGVGYRLIAISELGLADNQIPFYIVDIPEIRRVDSNGDLLLHGGFASLTIGF